MKNSMIFVFMALLAETCIIYASVLVKIIDMPPINVGFYRTTLALPVFFLLSYKKILNIPPKDIALIILCGAFFGCDVFFFNISLHHTSVANVNLIASLACFILVPIWIIFFKQRIKIHFFIGAVISFIGIIILIKGKGDSSVATLYGDFLAFISVVFFAIFLSLVYKLRKKYTIMEFMFFASFGASIVLFVGALCLEGIKIPYNAEQFFLVALIALCGQILGQGFFNYIMGKLSIETSSLILLFSPAIAAIMGFLILDEKIGIYEIIGMVIIVFGVYIVKR